MPTIAGDISPLQAAVLDQWQASGEVSFEDLHELMYAAFDCIEAGGVTVSRVWESEAWGQRVIEFSTQVTEAELEAGGGAVEEQVVAQCMAYNVGQVESLYASNPSAIEYANQAVAALYPIYGPFVVECLERNGVTVIDPDDHDEWFESAAELMLSDGGRGPDCLEESGWWAATREAAG